MTERKLARAALGTLICVGLFAQSPPPPAFEVASVKPTSPGSRDSISLFTYPGGRITVTQFTLKQLIQEAYSLDGYQVSGGPRWMDEDRYDIVAKPAASSEAAKFNPPTPKTRPTKEMRLMLQTLLADRFQLKVHIDSKQGPAYALVADAKGSKLAETKNHDAYQWVGGGRTDNPDRPNFVGGENASMARLATYLSKVLRRPVLDQTGLSGDFDFKAEYGGRDEPDASLSLTSAIQEQLGLKLVSTRAPGETLVVDHAEKPSAN